MTARRLAMGTRGSALALWQTHHIQSKLTSLFPGLKVEIVTIKTLGDKILDSPLSRIGDKGLFTKELEHHLLGGSIDLAVHSLKDVPTSVPAGLTVGAVTEREDVRDVFIANPAKPWKSIDELPDGATIATGSLRRTCQLLHARPDFRIVDIRGNLNTRLEKLEASDWDGMILAKAGVKRLGLESNMTQVLSFDVMLPAVGQGALAVEVRADDTGTLELIRPLHHLATAAATRGERALLRRLEGGCQVPIGTYGRIEDGLFRMDALIGSLDGRRVVRGSIAGAPENSEALGVELAEDLLARGGKEILDEINARGRSAPVPES
jgi:hydroxymethylbilane synthase